MTKHDVLAALHELVGHCGHCGERSCPGRDSHSTLPKTLSTDDVCRALKMAKRAAKKRRQCARDTAWISNAEARGDSGQSPAEPLTAVRECADAAQAGDASAARSASPLHASSEQGSAGELPRLGLAASEPAAPSELSALHEYIPSTSDGQVWRCFICGHGELSLCHAGKPVTKGGNP